LRQCAALASPTHSASRLTDLMLGEVETSESGTWKKWRPDLWRSAYVTGAGINQLGHQGLLTARFAPCRAPRRRSFDRTDSRRSGLPVGVFDFVEPLVAVQREHHPTADPRPYLRDHAKMISIRDWIGIRGWRRRVNWAVRKFCGAAGDSDRCHRCNHLSRADHHQSSLSHAAQAHRDLL